MPNSIPQRRLSVAMIMRDEAPVVAASLESVREIADEIVILDTGSSDDGPQIAERMGAKVFRGTWEDSFAVARNQCLKQVSGDWVLWLDAGERLDPHTAAELRAFVDQAVQLDKAYMLLVEIPPTEAGASAEQAAHVRLIPRNDALRFAGRVRESLQASLEAAGIEVELGPGRIVRHARQNDPAHRSRRARRDLALVALETAELGHQPPRLMLAQATAHSELEDRDQARQVYLQAAERGSRGSTEQLEAYYGMLAAMESPELHQLQISTCLQALEIFPLDAQLLLAMGSYLQRSNRLPLAARSFEIALQHGVVDMQTWHLRELGEVASICLSVTLQLQGQEAQAQEILEEALQRRPNSIRLRRPLLDLLVKQGREGEAVLQANAIPVEERKRPALRNAVRGACRAANRDWTAALGYLQSAYVEGYREPFCLRWLAVTLLCNNHIAAAVPVLREWQALEPHNPELQAYLQAIQRAGSSPAAAAGGDGKRIRLDSAQSSAEGHGDGTLLAPKAIDSVREF